MNLASPASPKDYYALPIETLDVGSIGTRNLLELARAQRRPVLHGVDERGVRRPRACTLSARTTGAT